MLLEIAVTVFFILVLTLGLVVYARWNYTKLDGVGFPVMKPSLLLGSAPDIHTRIPHFDDIARHKVYGPVWGYYQGRTPIVFIADPNLIRDIFVKDTSHFYDRKPLEFGNSVLNQILDFLPGEKWKTMRVSQTKLFSLGKIKSYSNDIFNLSMETLIGKFNLDLSSSGTNRLKIEARERFCLFSLDAIGLSMFSMNVDSEKDKGFYRACKKLIGDGSEVSPLRVWTQAFPFLSRFSPTLDLDSAMTDRFQELVKRRIASGVSFGDYVDVMVQCFQNIGSPLYKKLGITQSTILGQAVNLFLAGFDRISSHMAFLAYHLAKEPGIQDKLHAEIKNVCLEQGVVGRNIDYETIQKMEYLNACVTEVSRLYPVLIRPERVCNKNWEDPERGIKIPKGTVVMIAAWAVNRSEKYFEDPDAFIPERFLPKNKKDLNSFANTTFGFGHRTCIGMRFSYEALKASFARMLLNYKFEMRPDTKLEFKRGLYFILQSKPVYLDVVPRE